MSCRITGYWYRWSHHTSVYCCEECKEEDTAFRLGKHRAYIIMVGQPHPSSPPWQWRLEAVTKDEIHATLMIYSFYHPRATAREDIGDILQRCLEARHRIEGKGIAGAAEEWADFNPSQLLEALKRYYPPTPTGPHNEETQGCSPSPS